MTSVLIENVVVLCAIGFALNKNRKIILISSFISVLLYIIYNATLLAHFNPGSGNVEHSAYYWLTSMFFMGVFGMFMSANTKLSVIMGGCVLTQAILSFMVAMNGAVIGNYIMPEFDVVYGIHESFNKAIWIAECIVIYLASTTEKK